MLTGSDAKIRAGRFRARQPPPTATSEFGHHAVASEPLIIVILEIGCSVWAQFICKDCFDTPSPSTALHWALRYDSMPIELIAAFVEVAHPTPPISVFLSFCCP